MAAPSPTFRRSARHSVLIVVVFFCALTASWALVGRCLPFPAVPVVREKIEQLGRYGDEYDVLFVGSSRIYFQVLPAIFDGVVHEQGLPVRSFNAGIGAMRPPEDGYYLDQLLRCPHRRLRWVFLEVMPLNAHNDPILTATRRASYWHDGERTQLLTESCFRECAAACRGASRREIPWPEAIQTCSESLTVWLDNLRLFVDNYSSFGRGETVLRRQFGSSEERPDSSLEKGLAWDGWAFPNIAKPWTEDPKRRTAYERAYAGLLETDQRFEEGDAVSWEALRAKISRMTQAGVTPIMIIPPTVALKRYLPPQLAGESLAILDFSDPRKYPELFTLEHRLDGTHLNYAGAEIFSEEIARKFLEIVKKAGPAP